MHKSSHTTSPLPHYGLSLSGGIRLLQSEIGSLQGMFLSNDSVFFSICHLASPRYTAADKKKVRISISFLIKRLHKTLVKHLRSGAQRLTKNALLSSQNA